MIYIKNGLLYTMQGMSGLGEKRGNILIKEGKIAAVGEQELLPPDFEGEILNAEGCVVMPGIIEAHCHMGITEEKKGIEGDDCNETEQPITPYLRAIDAINPMDAAFGEAVRAGITAAMIGPGSSNVVGGQFAFVKTFGRRIDDLIVKAPAAMKAAFGENPKVNYSGQNKMPSTRMAIASMLREELFLAKQYMMQKEKKTEDFKEDFRYECWLPVLRKEIPLKVHVHRSDDIYTAIRIAQEYDLDITLDHCTEGHLIAEDISRSGYPVILGPHLASRSKIEIQYASFKTAGILEKNKVLFAITTDHPVSLIQSLPYCAGLAVKAGLSMEEGLRAITINPAKICGVADRMGSIEVGKDADIAIFSGNPMEIFTETFYTIIDGRIVHRRENMIKYTREQ